MYCSNEIGRSIAVMQPYFFPYIGYFQLLSQADIFVIYDDVHFIKQGWINRNRILINSEPKYLTIPCRGISSHKKINEIKHALDKREKSRLLKKVCLAYKSAPFFEHIFPLFKRVLNSDTESIAKLAASSIIETCSYINIPVVLRVSSESYASGSEDRVERLIDICVRENCNIYLNSSGGMQLYDKDYFASRGIELKFVEPTVVSYRQFGEAFVPRLSILDVLMFNSPDAVRHMLREYCLL